MEEFRKIAEKDLKVAYANAWSIENMAGHDAEGRSVSYIGNTCRGDHVTDYYIDSAGHYWFGNRVRVDGRLISMEEYIFGRKIKRKKRKKLTFCRCQPVHRYYGNKS